MRLSLLALAFSGGALLAAGPPPTALETPGRRADGAVLLPNQWLLRPAGRQLELGNFPVNIAIHPDGRHAAVLVSGFGGNEVVILNVLTNSVVSRASVQEAFYGLAFSPGGAFLYCSGAGEEVIHRFRFADGYLFEHARLPLRPPAQRGVPAGLAVSRDGENLYAVNLWGQSVTWLRPDDKEWDPLELALDDAEERGAAAPAPPVGTDDPAVTKRAAAALQTGVAEAPFPYGCCLDEKRRRLYVSLWAHGAIAVIETETFTEVARWKTGEHPNEMLLSRDGSRLFVANANENSVSVIDPESGAVTESLIAELQPAAPPGNTPNGVALAPDESKLFVANANINAVAVFDISQKNKARALGFIPTGWYPTSVRVTGDGRRLLVTAGKGLASKANRNGPRPPLSESEPGTEYIGGLLAGSLSNILLPPADRFERQMDAWTAQALAGRPETERKTRESAAVEKSPLPRKVGGVSPLKHVIYIVKENRTYDQVFGDMGKGNSEPALCLFGEKMTPNHHALAREFVLLDNFYVEAEVSADGHEWTVGAYATDFVEKMWPLSYGHNGHQKFPYPSEGRFRAATPGGGYLWDQAKKAGVSYRSYGEFVNNGKRPGDPTTTRVAALQGHFDPGFQSFDIDYSDVQRAGRFISELHRFEAAGEMPALQIVRLPSDHTAGTSPGRRTPSAFLGDNDCGLGMVVEAVSHSKFWPDTAIFVVEDDAQNGADHVDAHRTVALVVSPYTRRGVIDPTLYSTTSMLRTMELILGLAPMSQFDEAAMPMYASFQERPDLTPYVLRPPQVDLEERNSSSAIGARESQKMDFSREDLADDAALNAVLWKAMRGQGSAPPPPRRAAFAISRSSAPDRD